MSANETQVGGNHYDSKYQHWDFVRDICMGYIPAQITRYVTRWRKKNGLEDVDKALHYVQKFMENEKLRHDAALIRLYRFMSDNSLQEHERIVFHMLVKYQLGDEDRLQAVKEAIEELRAILTGEKPADPQFRDAGDEWKRP